MVRQSINNGKRSINLLGQYQPHQLVRQGKAAERNLGIRPLEHGRTQPQGTPNHKGNITVPVRGQLVDLLGKFFRSPFLALDSKCEDVLPVLDLTQDSFSPGSTTREPFIRNFHNLKLAKPPQPLCVFSNSGLKILFL